MVQTMNDVTAPLLEAPDSIEAIRAEMDKVDRDVLALVARRLKLAEGLVQLKQAEGRGLPIRPGREVVMLRRLIVEAPEPVEPDLVVELWRALIAANLRRQGPVDVAVGGTSDPVRLHDIARRHFGARTRIRRPTDPRTALQQAVKEPATVAVVPWLTAPGVGSWWPILSESTFEKLNLIAVLPIRGGLDEEPEACIFAQARPEPAGDDVSLVLAFDTHHRAQRALSEIGLKGREVARSEPKALLRVEGFIAPDDTRLAALARYGLDAVRVLGSFARV